MDIPVSRLNKRMAIQLPAEFPLGLVFVVGQIHDLRTDGGSSAAIIGPVPGGPAIAGPAPGRPTTFYLVEGEHRLRCQLSERAASEAWLKEGDRVRAGGHLAFDSQRADYYLLARDVELLVEPGEDLAPAVPILEDIKKRSEAANLAPAELPEWVRQIAPPDIRTQLEEQAAPPTVPAAATETVVAVAAPPPAATPEVKVAPAEERAGEAPAGLPPLPAGLTDELIAFLSEAMDSPEEVELTPDLISELAPAIQAGELRPGTARTGRPGPAKRDSQRRWYIAAAALIIFACVLIPIFLLFLYTLGFQLPF
ncbi:MAG: hypothetical protein L0332_04575 [Chloroflexi bacterium]|nr:hypothetical protein [Chloroflexota bacterium]MCI0580142.1 hypothetical protein [Chloroflexota bacterium]MCI0649282.1 hypothetical protein [Chloroflexota bacterium]MCI0725985.1 hypothetical protein [Chloroflexota bacterium]